MSASLSPVRSMRSIRAASAKFNHYVERYLDLVMIVEVADGVAVGRANDE